MSSSVRQRSRWIVGGGGFKSTASSLARSILQATSQATRRQRPPPGRPKVDRRSHRSLSMRFSPLKRPLPCPPLRTSIALTGFIGLMWVEEATRSKNDREYESILSRFELVKGWKVGDVITLCTTIVSCGAGLFMCLRFDKQNLLGRCAILPCRDDCRMLEI